jgi:hypothetical protein
MMWLVDLIAMRKDLTTMDAMMLNPMMTMAVHDGLVGSLVMTVYDDLDPEA